MSKSDEAVAIFQGGCNCSQAVLSAFAGDLGLDRDTALKIASGFGGGIGHTSQTCGAVTGAVMVIGLKNKLLPDKIYMSNQQAYDIISQLIQEFEKRNGSVICRDLIGLDFNDEEAYRDARKKGIFYSTCSKFVSDAVRIIEDIYG